MFDKERSKAMPMPSDIIFTTLGSLLAIDPSAKLSSKKLAEVGLSVLSHSGVSDEDERYKNLLQVIVNISDEIIAAHSMICITVAMLESHGIMAVEEIYSAIEAKSKKANIPVPDGMLSNIEDNLKWGHIQADNTRPVSQTEKAKL